MTLLTRSDDPALLLQTLIERDGRQAAACRLRAWLHERDRRVFVLKFDPARRLWLAGEAGDAHPIPRELAGMALIASAVRGRGEWVAHGFSSSNAARNALRRALDRLDMFAPELAAALVNRVSVSGAGARHLRRPTDPQILA